MVNRTSLTWMLRLTFIAVFLAHAYYLFRTGRHPGPDVVGLASFLWAPVASGVTAASLLFIAVERWLWRFSIFRGWLVLVPDLTGTWLAKSVSETFGGAPHSSVVTIDHRFDRLTYKAWRGHSILTSDACILERIGQTLSLFVFYRSEVGMELAEHSSDHDGSVRLRLLNEQRRDDWVLEGMYWTNKRRLANGPLDRGTVGKISMTFHGRVLEGEHSAIAREHLAKERRAEDEHRLRDRPLPSD